MVRGGGGTVEAGVGVVVGSRAVAKSKRAMEREIKEAVASMEPGLRAVAQRSVDAENSFLDYAMEHGRLDRDQARVALAAFRKARAIRFDAVNGTFHVKHGAFLEPDVIRRAAGVDE